MPRKHRDDHSDTIYHVICRGNNGEMIFRDDNDKVLYMSIVKRFKKRFDIKIYAYCIMDNHVHFLFHRLEDPLYKFMQVVQQTFTQHYNKKYGRTGHVFQQRYKSIPCRKDNYFLELIKYIHLNPVRANLEGGIDYYWSSHRIYSNGLKGSILETRYIYEVFAGTFKSGIREYNKFMNQKTDLRCIFYKDYELKNEELKSLRDEKKINQKDQELSSVIEKVCNEYGEQDKKAITERGSRKNSEIRKIIILATEKNHNISNNEIAEALNLSPSTITKVRIRWRDSEKYIEILKRLEED